MGTGNTFRLITCKRYNPVHPRGHGEHDGIPKYQKQSCGSSPWARGTLGLICTVLVRCVGGSSPWARGTHVFAHITKGNGRFIPVGTGNTPCGLCSGCQWSVHPRGHGEHPTRYGRNIVRGGSSPWARGTREFCIPVLSQQRFIPVGTGNTKENYRAARIRPVHPRGHGEHLVCRWFGVLAVGSSPWARGTLGCSG